MHRAKIFCVYPLNFSQVNLRNSWFYYSVKTLNIIKLDLLTYHVETNLLSFFTRLIL